MIRQWFILVILFALTAATLFNFVKEAVLYDPLAEMQSVEKKPPGKVITKADFKAAWSPVIQEDNLFSPRRGDVPEEPVEVAAPVEPVKEVPKKRPNLELDGIIVNQFGEYVAYISKDSEDSIALRVGDMIDDIGVIEISERTVHLIWQNEKIVLSLSKIETFKR